MTRTKSHSEIIIIVCLIFLFLLVCLFCFFSRDYNVNRKGNEIEKITSIYIIYIYACIYVMTNMLRNKTQSLLPLAREILQYRASWFLSLSLTFAYTSPAPPPTTLLHRFPRDNEIVGNPFPHKRTESKFVDLESRFH